MNNRNSLETARVNRPQRSQVEMHFYAWDQLLDPDHRARTVWADVQRLD